jgi:predicted metalloendopeptidase
MINNIRDAFKENFEKLEWMDKQTLQLAQNKADSIVDMIGIELSFSLLQLTVKAFHKPQCRWLSIKPILL